MVVKRLLQKNLRPGGQSALLVCANIERGHHDDRDHGKIRIYSEPLQDLKSVTCGQTQIQNNHIRPMLKSLAYRGHAILSENGIVVVSLKQHVIPETHIVVVLNDKNFFVTHDGQPPRSL